MRQYKIAFIGLGSIGKRHFNNVCTFLEERGDCYEIDLYRSNLLHELPQEIVEKTHQQILYDAPVADGLVYDSLPIQLPCIMIQSESL